MGIRDRVMADMKAAMLARRELELNTLRLIKAEFLKAEKEKGESLDDAREMAVLERMVKQRRDSIEQFTQAGRADLADRERDEMAIIEAYLPAPLTTDEVKSHVDVVLAAQAHPDPKQAGKITGEVMGRLKATGRPFDAKLATQMIRERLGLG